MSDGAWIVILGTAGMLMMAVAIIIFVFLYQRKVANKELQLRKTQQMLNSLELSATYNFLKGQHEQQQRIAADLHDNLGSQLGIIALQVQGLSQQGQPALGKLEEMVNIAMKDVRDISHQLHQGLFRGENLDKAISQVIDDISANTSLIINYDSHGLRDNTSEELGLELFRIIQELLSNTVKHAEAVEVNIDLNYYKHEHCNLLYTDDGKGFDQSRTTEGIGLKTIRERARRVNGKVYVSSSIANGTETVIEIDL